MQRFRYMAIVNVESRHHAKSAGFWWDNDMRIWIKDMTHDEAMAMRNIINFSIQNLTTGQIIAPRKT